LSRHGWLTVFMPVSCGLLTHESNETNHPVVVPLHCFYLPAMYVSLYEGEGLVDLVCSYSVICKTVILTQVSKHLDSRNAPQ